MIAPFVDAHHHLWDLERNLHPWLQQDPALELVCGSVARISHTYGLEEFDADVGALPLVGAVIVEAGWAGAASGEVSWWKSLPMRIPRALVARAPLLDPDVGALLEELAEDPQVAAIRDIAAWHPDPRLAQVDLPDLLDDSRWRDNLALACRLGLAFDLQIYPGQVDQAMALVHELSGARVAVEHSLMPAERGPAGRTAWRRGLRRMAAAENLVLKISGLGMCLHETDEREWSELIADMLEAFGPDRCMLGSNFPVDSMFLTYPELWARFDHATSGLTGDERDSLFRTCAEGFYQLDRVRSLL